MRHLRHTLALAACVLVASLTGCASDLYPDMSACVPDASAPHGVDCTVRGF